MTRKALFDALRPFAPGRAFTAAHVPLINAVADAFGLPLDPPEGSRVVALGDKISPSAFSIFAPNAVPHARPELEAAAGRHSIRARALASFLGQYHHESAGFSQMTESLNYSVEGLLKTFGRHRISEADCRRLGRTATRPADQEAIANIVYGGEWGRANLGNTQPGDGWRYRGRGFGGTTGRANYREAGHEADPDALLDPAVSAEVSAAFFVSRGCVPLALAGDDEGVTRKINGGVNGLADRIALTRQALTLI